MRECTIDHIMYEVEAADLPWPLANPVWDGASECEAQIHDQALSVRDLSTRWNSDALWAFNGPRAALKSPQSTSTVARLTEISSKSKLWQKYPFYIPIYLYFVQNYILGYITWKYFKIEIFVVFSI